LIVITKPRLKTALLRTYALHIIRFVGNKVK
jgi:hypothetical protein